MAFLGSPLSVSPLLPWLLVKSLFCPFVAKLFFFPPKAPLCVMTQALTWGKCRHLSHTLWPASWCLVHTWKHTVQSCAHTVCTLTYHLLLLRYSPGMSCHCWYDTTEQLKFPAVRCGIISRTQGAPPVLLPAKDTARWELQLSDWIWHWSIIRERPFRMEWQREGEGERYEKTGTMGEVREETKRESAVEESDFYHRACTNWERWVQWQPLPSGVETAYTAYRMGYQLCKSIGAGADRVI